MQTDTGSKDYHYHVIARALREIDAPGGQALSLDALAARLNMSPAHFQRTFSAWVGVSPKRYQQYLTLDHAKALLVDRFTVLDPRSRLAFRDRGGCMICFCAGKR